MPEETDGTPAARARAAAAGRGAGLRLNAISRPSEVMREIENTALTELDVAATRRMTDVDRRFQRARSKLGAELARRQEAVTETFRPRHPITLDLIAFLVAAVAIGLILSVDRSGAAIETDAALVGAAGLGVVAVVIHLTSSIRASRSRASSTQSGPFLMLTTGILFGAVIGGYWRVSKDSDAGFLTAATALGVLIAAGVFTAVLFARGSAERKAEARQDSARREREDAMRADLLVQLDGLIAASRTEAQAIFDGLGADKRTHLEAAVDAGIAAVEKRGILATAAVRGLRASRRGDLRYDVDL